jgi:hypothetical protein
MKKTNFTIFSQKAHIIFTNDPKERDKSHTLYNQQILG